MSLNRSIINNYYPLCNLTNVMSVVGISLFRWFCLFILYLIFMLETLHLIFLHCIITLLHIYKYISHRFTHTRFTLTIPLTLPHTLSTKPLPTFLLRCVLFFHSHYMCNGSDMYIDTR